MLAPPPLPRTLFEELGKIVVIWATIEQNLVLHCSAMAAQKTGGKTSDFLRLDFKRLREKWFALCRENFDAKTVNKTVTPLNMELARLSIERGYAVHGLWSQRSRGKFILTSYEQKSRLISYQNEVSLMQLKQIRHDSYLLSKRVDAFVSGEDDGPNFKRAHLVVVSEHEALS